MSQLAPSAPAGRAALWWCKEALKPAAVASDPSSVSHLHIT